MVKKYIKIELRSSMDRTISVEGVNTGSNPVGALFFLKMLVGSKDGLISRKIRWQPV